MKASIKDKKLDSISKRLSLSLREIENMQRRKDLDGDDKFALEKLNQSLNVALSHITIWRMCK